MERDARRALEARMEANRKLARHNNAAIRTGRTHTSAGEVYLVNGQRRRRKQSPPPNGI